MIAGFSFLVVGTCCRIMELSFNTRRRTSGILILRALAGKSPQLRM